MTRLINQYYELDRKKNNGLIVFYVGGRMTLT